MMVDRNFFDKLKSDILEEIKIEMSTKEKQKGLSRHILWTEPKNTVFNDLVSVVNSNDVKRILESPDNFETEIATITHKYFLAFPDPEDTLIGLNLFYINKQVYQNKNKDNVKKVAQNYMSIMPQSESALNQSLEMISRPISVLPT